MNRPPRKEWLDEEKKRLFFEQQVGSSQEAMDAASALHRSLLDIRQQLHGLPDDRQQAKAALKVKERATAERMMEVAQEGSPRTRAARSDALASLDLQLRVDISSVEWYMMDRSWEPTAYFAMQGAAITQQHFADLSTQSSFCIDEFVMMDDERNEVFARNQLPPLPGQSANMNEDKLLEITWKTEGQWKAGIKIFDRLEVVLQPVRISIAQELIDHLKLYAFPPPLDTRMAQQAFMFADGDDAEVAQASTSDTSARVSRTEAEPDTTGGGGGSHFGDRLLVPEGERGAETGGGGGGGRARASTAHFGDRMMVDTQSALRTHTSPEGGGGGHAAGAAAAGGGGAAKQQRQRSPSSQDGPGLAAPRGRVRTKTLGVTLPDSSSLFLAQADDADGGEYDEIEDDDGAGGGVEPKSLVEDLAVVAMERAQKAHAFGTIRLGTLDIEASYRGKMLPAFDRLPLRVKALSYQREVWTMQELLEKVGWDIKMAVAKSVANSTISAAGSKMSKLGGQMLAPAAGAAKRSMFELKKQSLLGAPPPPQGGR